MLKKILLYVTINIVITGCSNKNNFYNTSVVEDSKIKVCFTPPAGCANEIIQEINNARKNIYVQAYGLTNYEIIESLVLAKQRGVNVQLLLDKSNIKNHKILALSNVGADIAIDKVSGIAHNKVMIIDNQTVITGSFNFTRSADIRNSENVVFIYSKEIANQYLTNWRNRLQNSLRISY